MAWRACLLAAIACSVNVVYGTVERVARIDRPLDAALTSQANKIYFVATNPEGRAAVFRTGPHGGTMHEIAVAAVGHDLRSLVVADEDNNNERLVVASLSGSVLYAVERPQRPGATLTAIQPTLGYKPRGVAVVPGNPRLIYFTGRDPAHDVPGLYAVYSVLPEVRIVIRVAAPVLGSAFIQPDAVVVSQSKIAYVTDTGRILRVSSSDGAVSVLVPGPLSLGNPAGLALTSNDTRLLVSSLDSTGRCQVLIIDTDTGVVLSAYKDPQIQAHTACGGIHRADGEDVFAWAGVTSGTTGAGSVFRVTLS